MASTQWLPAKMRGLWVDHSALVPIQRFALGNEPIAPPGPE
jgi:hypothetical protein